MQIKYTLDAFESLTSLINFIESKNTKGSGSRWLENYESFLIKKLNNAKRINICRNTSLGKLRLHCIYFHEWLIAFSIHEDYILIEALFHKSRIRD